MRRTLMAKGFREENTHHKAFWLYVDGLKTSIKTFFSHGQNEYDAFLLAKVRKQMNFGSGADFDDFMDCRMDGASYVKRMKECGHIVDPSPLPPSKSVRKKKK